MSATETPDQASTRRRWITLAEVVAVAGVVIAALTLYTSWSDRRADQAEHAAAEAGAAREKARLTLAGAVGDDGRTVTLHDGDHDLTDLTVRFPTALGLAVRSPADLAIDARWFEDAILKLTDKGGDDRTGRLPVLMTASYVDGDAARTGSAIYDIVWSTHGRMLRGRALRIEGLKLRGRAGTKAALDAAWSREKP